MSWTMISAIPKSHIGKKIKSYKQQKIQRTLAGAMEEDPQFNKLKRDEPK